MSINNESRRAAAKWGEHPTYRHDVVETWTACTECGVPIRHNVETGRPGLWRECGCFGVVWCPDYRGGGWRREQLPLPARPKFIPDEPSECGGCESPLCPTHGRLR